jgi:hypothetical protein
MMMEALPPDAHLLSYTSSPHSQWSEAGGLEFSSTLCSAMSTECCTPFEIMNSTTESQRSGVAIIFCCGLFLFQSSHSFRFAATRSNDSRSIQLFDLWHLAGGGVFSAASCPPEGMPPSSKELAITAHQNEDSYNNRM